MSFPSAVALVESGATPEAALIQAASQDTPLGFEALSALSIMAKGTPPSDPVQYIQSALPEHARKDVLRSEPCGKRGIKVDFDPDSVVGRQIARLMTDAMRPLLEDRFAIKFGFANCCGGIASEDEEDVEVTAADQVRWQTSIDC